MLGLARYIYCVQKLLETYGQWVECGVLNHLSSSRACRCSPLRAAPRSPQHQQPSACAAASAAMPLRPIASARKLRAVSADCVAAPSARRLAARGSHLVTRTSAMAPVAGSCRRPRQRRAAPLAPRRRSSCRNYCPALPTMTFRASLAVKCAILTQSRSYSSSGSFGRVK